MKVPWENSDATACYSGSGFIIVACSASAEIRSGPNILSRASQHRQAEHELSDRVVARFLDGSRPGMMLDLERVHADAEKVTDFCAKNPDVKVFEAAKLLFGH
jgi:hypothetical protein